MEISSENHIEDAENDDLDSEQSSVENDESIAIEIITGDKEDDTNIEEEEDVNKITEIGNMPLETPSEVRSRKGQLPSMVTLLCPSFLGYGF